MVPGEKPSSIKYRENSTSYLSSRAQWPHLVNVWQGWNPRIFYRLVKGRVGGENPRRKPPGSPTENIFGTPSTSEIPTPPPRRNPCSKLLDYTARPRAEQNSTSVQSSKRPQAEEVLLFGATITLITWWFSSITSNGVGSPHKNLQIHNLGTHHNPENLTSPHNDPQWQDCRYFFEMLLNHHIILNFVNFKPNSINLNRLLNCFYEKM